MANPATDKAVKTYPDESLQRPLNKLQEGEFSYVKRVFSEQGHFSFTGKERIESVYDVAHIFELLENETVENAFAVFVKDGKPVIQHLGIGDFKGVVINIPAIIEAFRRINPDQVYFVHNHPSGRVIASRQDQLIYEKLKKAIGSKLAPGIIINLRTGHYGVYDEYTSDKEMKEGVNGDVPIKVFSFNKQVFEKDYDPENLTLITHSEDVSKFISGHRLGERDKISVMILSRGNRVVANLFTPYTEINAKNMKEFADFIVSSITSYGGQTAIPYGRFPLQNIEKLSLLVQQQSGDDDMRLCDAISIDSSGTTTSAMEIGVMESEVNYKSHKMEDDKILSAIKEAYVNGFPVIYNSSEYPPLFNKSEGFREFAEENGFTPGEVMFTFNLYRKDIEKFVQEDMNDIILGNFSGNNATQQLNSSSMEIDEKKINWQELKEKHGVTREGLQEAGVLDDVLKGYKSAKLVQLTYEAQDGPRSFNARIRLQEKDEAVGLVYYPVRQAPALEQPYFGYEFTEQDKKNILETGNLGHTAEIERKGERVKVLISVDSLTNDLVHADVDKIRLSDQIKGVTLTEQQKSFLLEGKPVQIKDMTSNAGNKFSSYVMINAEKRSLEFVQLKPNVVENIQDLKELNGVAISEENRKVLSEGGSVFIEGMTSRDGREYSANVKYDPEAKRMKYEFPKEENKNQEFRIPNKIKGVILTEEQKTKLAAGEKVFVKDMTSQNGKLFSNEIYIDKTENKIKFEPFKPKESKEQTTKQSDDMNKAIKAKQKKTPDDNSKKKSKGVKM